MTIAESKTVLPESIRRVVELGVRAVNADKVILYGSRAHGDAREDSDYDLAFVFSKNRRNRWVNSGALGSFIRDSLQGHYSTPARNPPVLGRRTPEQIREHICKEGVVLYERIWGDRKKGLSHNQMDCQ